jgi:hypothetical protein
LYALLPPNTGKGTEHRHRPSLGNAEGYMLQHRKQQCSGHMFFRDPLSNEQPALG